MTPEAKTFRGGVVQTIRGRMRDPFYAMFRHEYGGSEMHKHQLMILGSVLLPEAPAGDDGEVPPFYLDDPARRALIASQLAIRPTDFLNNANIVVWGRLSLQSGDRTLGRRFYAVNKTVETSWGYYAVPNDAEYSAEDSAIPRDAVTLPDFVAVTNEIRYRAIGA